MSVAPAPAAHDPVGAREVRHAKKGRGLGIASFVLATLVVLSYEVMVVIIGVLVLAVPGWLTILVELTEATGVPFVILTGGPWVLLFGVSGLAAVPLLISAIVYFCAILACGLSIVFGIVALVRRGGRAFPVTGVLLSAAVLAVNLVIYLLWLDITA